MDDDVPELQTGPTKDGIRPSSDSERAGALLDERYRAGTTTIQDSGMEIISDPHHVRSDLRLLQRAIKNRWPISDEMREKTVKAVYALIDSGTCEERWLINAAKVLAQMDGLNARREEASGGKNNVTVNVGVNVNAGGQAIDILSMSEQERETAIASGAVVDPKQLEHLSQDELVRLHRAACSVGVTSR